MEFAKGQRTKLPNTIQLTTFSVAIKAVSSTSKAFTISCFGLDENKKFSDDQYLICPMQRTTPCGSIALTEVKKNGFAFFKIYLRTLPRSVSRLMFTITGDDEGVMSHLQRGFMMLSNKEGSIGGYVFDQSDFQNKKIVLVAEIYFKDTWRIGIINQGFKSGWNTLFDYLAITGKKHREKTFKLLSGVNSSTSQLGISNASQATFNDSHVGRKLSFLTRVKRKSNEYLKNAFSTPNPIPKANPVEYLCSNKTFPEETREDRNRLESGGIKRSSTHSDYRNDKKKAFLSSDSLASTSTQHAESLFSPPNQTPKTNSVELFHLNAELIRIREEETQEVKDILETVFSDDTSDENDPISTTTTAAYNASEDDPLASLDQAHQRLLYLLINQETWERPALNEICQELGLMTAGAMEVLNEWAFENADAPLMEDGEPIYIDMDLAKEIINA